MGAHSMIERQELNQTAEQAPVTDATVSSCLHIRTGHTEPNLKALSSILVETLHKMFEHEMTKA